MFPILLLFPIFLFFVLTLDVLFLLVFNFGALFEPFLFPIFPLSRLVVTLLFVGLVGVLLEGLEKFRLLVFVCPPFMEREGVLAEVAGLVAFGLLAVLLGLEAVCPPPPRDAVRPPALEPPCPKRCALIDSIGNDKARNKTINPA